jgi:hypothetical protein
MYPRVDYEQGVGVGPGIDFVSVFETVYEKSFGADWQSFLDMLGHWWDIYSIFAIILSIIFFVGFIYAKIRYGELHHEEQEHLREAEHRWAERFGGVTTKNTRWGEIEHHIMENNPQSWKIAVIEADILLEETLTNAGYVGGTIGDKLKTANPSSFTTLQDAWEAHKVRNQIAHEGSDFVLTRKIAQETIIRFERVFREFDVI